MFHINAISQNVEFEEFTLSPISKIDIITSLQTDAESNDPDFIKITEFKPFKLDNSETNTIILAQLGDERAIKTLQQRHLGLCKNIARKGQNKFKKLFSDDNSLDFEDFLQLVTIHFLNTIKKFNPRFNAKLSTYASAKIPYALDREMIKVSNLKTLTRKHINDIISAITIFKNKNGYTPSHKEIALALNNQFDDKKIRKLLKIYNGNKLKSLDAPVQNAETSTTPLKDFISDKRADSLPSIIIEQTEKQQQIQSSLKFLDDKEKYIIQNRFLTQEKTLKEISQDLDIRSRESVRQIQFKVLEVLKPILLFIQNIPDKQLLQLENTINRTIEAFPPLTKEIIYLAYIKKIYFKDIGPILNISTSKTINLRDKFLENLQEKLQPLLEEIPEFNEYKEAKGINISRFVRAFLKTEKIDPIHIIEKFIIKELKVNINTDACLKIFKNYTHYLTERDIRIITLKYHHNMTTKVISERLNISSDTISNRIRQIKKLISSRILIENITEHQVYEPLKNSILEGLNQIPLKKRQIFLTLFYDNFSISDTAKKHSIHRATVSNIKKEILKILQEKSIATLNQNRNLYTNTLKYQKVLNILETEFENYFKGFIYEIKRNEFSDQEKPPALIEDILFKIIKERIKPQLTDISLKLIANDAALFIDPFYINETNFKIFQMYYLEGIPQTKIANILKIPLTKIQASIRYRTSTLKRVVKMYASLNLNEITDIKNLIAESINEMEFRKRQTLIYFSYDNLNYEQIDKIKGLTVTKRSSQGKFQRTFSDLQKRILEKTESEKIKNIFEGNLDNLKYFIKSMRLSFTRSHFNIPEIITTKNQPLENENNKPSKTDKNFHPDPILKERFSLSFLKKVATHLDYSDEINDDDNLTELASILNTLNNKQVIMLALLVNNKLTNDNTRKELNMILYSVKQRLKSIENKLNAYKNFTKNLKREERSQLRKIMIEKIMNLPLIYKTQIIYYYYDNLSLNDIANIFKNSNNANYNLVRANKLLRKNIMKKIKSERIRDLLKNSRNFKFLLYSIISEVKREYFNISLPPGYNIDTTATPEEIYNNISSDDRISIHTSLMNAINSLSFNDKRIIISIFHDKLSLNGIRDIIGFNFSQESLNDILQKLILELKKNLNPIHFKYIFKDRINNLIFFLNKIDIEIPRILFNIPLNPTDKKTQTSLIEDLYFDNQEDYIISNEDTENSEKDEDNESKKEVTDFNYFNINDLLFNLGKADTEEDSIKLKNFLDVSMERKETLFPHPMALYSSKLFSKSIFSKLKSNKDILNYFLEIKTTFHLSMNQISHLYFIITNSGYVDLKPSFNDQIVIDFDSLEMTKDNKHKNKNQKQRLKKELIKIKKEYDKNKRSFSITFISKNHSKTDIKNILSMKSLKRFDEPFSFYSFKSSKSKTEIETETYSTFFFNLLREHNINHVNLKLFSNNINITESAKKIGAITINHNTSLYEALQMMAEIHPNKSFNFPVADSNDTVKSLIERHQLGILSLAGYEFCSLNLTKNKISKYIPELFGTSS